MRGFTSDAEFHLPLRLVFDELELLVPDAHLVDALVPAECAGVKV